MQLLEVKGSKQSSRVAGPACPVAGVLASK